MGVNELLENYLGDLKEAERMESPFCICLLSFALSSIDLIV